MQDRKKSQKKQHVLVRFSVWAGAVYPCVTAFVPPGDKSEICVPVQVLTLTHGVQMNKILASLSAGVVRISSIILLL